MLQLAEKEKGKRTLGKTALSQDGVSFTWKEYPVIGFLVAEMCVILDLPRSGGLMTVPVLVFFFLTGFMDNIRILGEFVRRLWYLVLITAAYLVYFCFTGQVMGSAEFILAIFFTVFSGYLLAVQMGDKLEEAYGKLWAFLLAVLILGIVKHLNDGQVGYFMDDPAELTAVVIFVVMTILYMKDIRLKIAGLVTCVVSGTVLIRAGNLSGYHVTAIKRMIPVWLQRSKKQVLLGRGFLQVREQTENLADNLLSSLLYDFGIVMLILMIAVLLYAGFIMIRTKDTQIRKQAILTGSILLVCAFSPVAYRGNVLFLVYLWMGVLLGAASGKNTKENKETQG